MPHSQREAVLMMAVRRKEVEITTSHLFTDCTHTTIAYNITLVCIFKRVTLNRRTLSLVIFILLYSNVCILYSIM